MDQQPNYRRRRAAAVIAGLMLLAMAQREEPSFATLSVDFDSGRAPRFDAELAPPLRVVATAAVYVADRLTR